MINEKVKSRYICKSIKAKTLATVIAIIASVALPQLFHLMGAFTGVGTRLGEIFLPMHIGIIAVGLLAGPVAGVIAGTVSPVISFMLSGMPNGMMLPFMVVELAAYGLAAGLIGNKNLPAPVKLVIVQLAGRLVRLIAVIIAYYGLNFGMSVSSFLLSLVCGLPGILLQLALISLIMIWAEHKTKDND